MTAPRRPGLSTGRLEAFSDGVFAIAITLLVLDVGIPDKDKREHLWGVLGQLWPHYGAYAVSFLTIGIMWANHHALMHQVQKAGSAVVYLNLLLLAVVSFIPFPTGVLADYLFHTGDDQVSAGGANARAAAGLYGLTMVALAVSFTLLWWYLTRTPDVLVPGTDPVLLRRSLIVSGGGTCVYAVAAAISFVNAYVASAIYALLALAFAFVSIRQTVNAAVGATRAAPDRPSE